jgi:hypothetical protein
MNTISQSTIHRVFRYGTHEQLANSIQRWLKNGIATPTVAKYYKINKLEGLHDIQELEIHVIDKHGRQSLACAVVAKDTENKMTLLAGSVWL